MVDRCPDQQADTARRRPAPVASTDYTQAFSRVSFPVAGKGSRDELPLDECPLSIKFGNARLGSLKLISQTSFGLRNPRSGTLSSLHLMDVRIFPFQAQMPTCR